MTLRSVLKLISEVKYSVIVKDGRNYEWINIDYCNPNEDFADAVRRREAVAKRKNRVEYISYNKVRGILEVEVSLV